MTPLVLPCCLGALALAGADPLRVDADFPGGAAHVIDIDQSTRRVRFQVPESDSLRSWWYFHVSGVRPGETITLELVDGKARARRAAYSLDRRLWRFTAPGVEDEATDLLTYRQRIDGAEAWFAWYAPYLLADAVVLVDRAERASPHAKKFILCESEGKRPVPAVRVAQPGAADDERFGVWIQARQHAWETGGSWTAHGLVEWLISDEPRAAALRRKAAITIVPIMDVDSVERGLGGKWQQPHDHNRDWSDRPHWRAVDASMREAARLDAAGRLDLFLDLHDPTWEAGFEFWCNPYPTMTGVRRRNTDRFLAAMKAEIVGPLRFDPEVYSPYPVDTPTAGNWSSQRTRPTVVGGTCEIGVCPPGDLVGDPPSFQLIAGRQLGLAIERYLDLRNRTDARAP
jgi:hypothetical protein